MEALSSGEFVPVNFDFKRVFGFKETGDMTPEQVDGLWEKWHEARVKKEAERATKYNSPEEVERRKWLLEERRNKNILESGIGERYLGTKLSDYKTENEMAKNIVKKVKSFIANYENRTLWMVGNPGTGKTMLAAAILRYLGGRYIKSYDLENETDSARYFSSGIKIADIVKKYVSCEVLIIDEIGKLGDREDPKFLKYLFQILNERYEKKLTTILISNLTKEEMIKYLGAPLYDRFKENCDCLEFNFESQRVKMRNNERRLWKEEDFD